MKTLFPMSSFPSERADECRVYVEMTVGVGFKRRTCIAEAIDKFAWAGSDAVGWEWKDHRTGKNKDQEVK